jgi:hypothetical protein
MALISRSINEMKDIVQEKPTNYNSCATVFIDRQQGLPIVIGFQTLTEAWQYGISYLYNHTEGAVTLFPLNNRLLLQNIALKWANKESSNSLQSTSKLFSLYQTPYLLGGSSLFNIIIYQGHEIPPKNTCYCRSGIIISGPAKAMLHGPYSQFIDKISYETVPLYNESTEWRIFTLQDTQDDWHSQIEDVIHKILLELKVF